MGTFAEIQCDNDLVADGENFLSCLENTLWDYPVPNCVVKTSTEYTPDQNTVETSATEKDDNEDIPVEDDDDLVVPTPKAPTMAFWQSLKKFLYHGCNALHNTSSELCWKISKPVELSDLSGYQPPETDEPMDKKLVEHLQRCVNNLNKFSFSQKLSFENVFDCITTGMHPSDDVKDSLRLIVCFYIDTVSLITEPNNRASTLEENITDQIRRHLTRIVTVVFQNYLRDLSYEMLSNADYSTRTTEMTHESACNLMLIPTFPTNTTIKNITSHRAKLTVDFADIRMVPILVPEMTKVHFECAKGHQLIGKDYTECLFGEWTDIGFDCERKCSDIVWALDFVKETNLLAEILCESPPQSMYMDMDYVNETPFSIGYKIQLKCKEGFVLYGNPLIFCTSDGEWTKVMARCSSESSIFHLVVSKALLSTFPFRNILQQTVAAERGDNYQ